MVAILIAPVTCSLINYLVFGVFGDFLLMFAFLFLFGLFFSAPALLVYYLVFAFGTKTIRSYVVQKTILNVVALVCLAITFEFLRVPGSVVMWWGYALAIVLSSIFLKMSGEETEAQKL